MRDNWMRLSDFNHKYVITNRNHVHVVYYNKKPAWIKRYNASHTKVKQISVNAGYLERVAKFRTNLYEEAYELYYEMFDMYGSGLAIARELSGSCDGTTDSWRDFLSVQLFKTRNEDFTILQTTIAKRVVRFVRFSRRRRLKEQVA